MIKNFNFFLKSHLYNFTINYLINPLLSYRSNKYLASRSRYTETIYVAISVALTGMMIPSTTSGTH